MKYPGRQTMHGLPKHLTVAAERTQVPPTKEKPFLQTKQLSSIFEIRQRESLVSLTAQVSSGFKM